MRRSASKRSRRGGGSYWMCWWLPVVVVIGVVGVLLFPRSSRPFACGLIVGLVRWRP
ncbi:hypothetical protein GS415_00020 [Rhodococcus hoagii]|nr:hypothetical protein [Prescottella equi]